MAKGSLEVACIKYKFPEIALWSFEMNFVHVVPVMSFKMPWYGTK